MNPTDNSPPSSETEATSSTKPDWCRGCPLYTAPGPVFAAPPKRNKVLFLGSNPGQDEVIQNRNFVGGAGRVLRAWCRKVNLDINSVEVRNVVKCRCTTISPVTGRVIDREPSEAEIQHCARFLAAELEIISPNVIVALGATALYVTTGQTAIGTYRGVCLEGPLRKGTTDRVKVLPVFHPAYIMRQQEQAPLAVFDFNKVHKEAQSAALVRITTDYNTTGRFRTNRDDILQAARAAGVIVFDLEAEGIVAARGKGLDLSTGAITVMGLTTEPYKAEALDHTPEVIALCTELFADERIEKVTQNGEGFDIPYCERRGYTFRGRSFDTLQAFHLTNPELEMNLPFIGSLYSDIPYWKGKQMYRSGRAALMQGNCTDVDVTARAKVALKEELRSLDMLDLYYNGVMPVQPVLRKMGDRGLRKNEAKAHAWSLGAKRLAAQIEEKVHNVIGHDVNLDSPKQLSHLLYEVMGLPVQYRRDKKRGNVPTVDDNALETLATQTANPIFSLIHKRRKIGKLDSTYLNVEADEHGFVHYHIGSAKGAMDKGEKGSAARNGRLISWGPNFQNQPLEVRELYEADSTEHVLIEPDWSQIEWRLAMVLSAEPVGLELLTRGVDNHRAVAAETLSKAYGDVTDEERFQTKFIVYGLGYGRGAVDIAKQLRWSVPEAERFIASFAKRFPVYWAWRRRLEGLVSKESYLRNAFGRRRWWYTRQVTEMYNFPPSSTAADMMYRVLPIAERELPDGATLRLTVHDQMLVNSPKDVARRAVECVRDIMQCTWDRIVEYSDNPQTVRRFYKGGWFCPVDVHVGVNWRECKKGNADLERSLGI